MNRDLLSELPQREVFILRLWRPGDHSGSWQAQIQHIGSGKVTQVHNSQELIDFISHHIELSIPRKAGKAGLK